MLTQGRENDRRTPSSSSRLSSVVARRASNRPSLASSLEAEWGSAVGAVAWAAITSVVTLEFAAVAWVTTRSMARV